MNTSPKSDENCYRKLFNHSLDGVLITQLNGEILYANPAACTLFDYTEAELQTGGCDLITNARDLHLPNLLDKRHSNSHIIEELTFTRRDGTTFVGEISSTLFTTTTNNQNQAILFIRDVTDRKQVEAISRKNEELYASLVNSLPQNLYRIDLDGRITFVNQNLIESLGVPEEEILGQTAYDFYPPDLAKKYRRDDQHVVDTGQPLRLVEENIDQVTGQSIFVDVLKIPIFDDDGQVVGIQGLFEDITERKRTEDALRQSEAQHRRLVQNINAGIVVHAPDTNITLANQRASELLGLTIDQMMGKTAIDPAWHFICDDGREMRVEDYPINRVIADQSPISDYVVGIHRPKTHDVAWVLVNAFPEWKKDGTMHQVVVTFVDITALKETEEALRESEQRYQAFITQSFEGIYRTEFDNPIDTQLPIETQIDLIYDNAYMAECNLALAQMYNVPSVSALIGARLIDAHGGKDNPVNRAAFRSFIENGYKSINDETVEYDTNGDTIWFLSNTVGFVEDGYLVRLWGTALDITQRKRAEIALRQSEENLRITLDSIGDAVIATDTDGYIIRMNPIAEKLSGWSQEDAIGELFNKVFPLIDHQSRAPISSPVMTALQLGQIIDLSKSVLLLARDGSEHYITTSGAPILNGQEAVMGVVLVLRDVTQQVQTEEALLNARKLESLGVLAGGIAHDFNNLLMGLFGNLDLAKFYLSPTHQVYEYLENASRAMEKARGLTNQLLTFARGGSPVKDIQAIDKLLKETATFAMHGSNAKLNLEIAPDLWLAAVDEGQFSRVINNLIINARQAMPQGGVITVTASNVESNGEPAIKIMIQDEGVGIDPKDMDKIFDPYFSTKSENSGLGLTAVHSIVTKHNGQIMVSSPIGEGTTFTILLPADPHASLPNESDSEAQPVPEPIGSARILVLDDDEILREVLEAVLTHLGHQVTLTEDGQETIAVYETALRDETPYDAVILDLTIPGGMDGQEVARRILFIDPQARLVVSSGYAHNPVMAKYKEYGFKARIQKPYEVDTLRQVLHTVLA